MRNITFTLANIILATPAVERPRTAFGDQRSAQNPDERNNSESPRELVWDNLIQGDQVSSMSLDSIAWEDVFDPVTPLLDPQADTCKETNIDGPLPTPASPSTTSSSKKPVVQEVAEPTYRFDISSFIPVSSTFEVMSPTMMTEYHSQPTRLENARDAPGPEILEDENTAPDLQCHKLDTDLVGPAQNHELSRVNKDGQLRLKDHSPYTVSITFATLSDESIQALAGLGTAMMKHLHRIMEYKSTDCFVLSQSNAQCENSIGKMLQYSERFLDIIKVIKRPSPSRNYAFSQHSLDLDRSNDNCGESGAIPDPSPDDTWTDSQPKPDLPSTLAILSCYTCLLQIYEAVFAAIQQSLEASQSFTLPSAIPPTVPSTIHGLHINGFMLQNHHTLQLRILIQASKYMLESIEKALQEAGILDDLMFQTLLRASLQRQNRKVTEEKCETGMGVVLENMKQLETRL